MKLSNRSLLISGGIILLLIIIGFSYFISDGKEMKPDKVLMSTPEKKNLEFGFDLDKYTVTEGVIEKNEFLSDILLPHKVPYQNIHELAQNCKYIYDVRKLRSGKKYLILNSDTSSSADYFIYQPNKIDYVVYDLKNPCADLGSQNVTVMTDTAGGIIHSSLWNAMDDIDLSWRMISKMESALAWSVDFYHIQPGDQFKLVYEKLMIDGEVVGLGKLHAAYYNTGNKEYYSILFEKEGFKGFYDLQARPMKKAFLKSPVEYGRISSRYNLRRRHPILKRVRPHLGTDYAAPRGTPIRSVADGVVTRASYTGGNGNYVKVKHDKTYTTQYLHMTRHADHIRPGVRVSQGETIGYVGSTGLATGPHVCFRFWKNGRQVDHMRQDLPDPEPMPENLRGAYYERRDSMKQILDQIEVGKYALANENS